LNQNIRVILFILAFALPVLSIAQTAENLAILPDEGYSIDAVRTLHQKRFIPYIEGARFEKEAYWVRFVAHNTSPYSQKVAVFPFPMFHNELYYYDYAQKKWAKVVAGMEVYTGYRRNNVHPITLQGGRQDTLYLKIKTAPLLGQKYQANVSVYIELYETYFATEMWRWLWWVTTMGIMGAFFVYNLYIYWVFRDAAHLYYLLIVASGMFYITGLNHYFNVLWQARFYQIEPLARGIFHVDISSLMTHIGILGVMTGFVHFTCHYLQLAYYAPVWNRGLQIALWVLWGSFLISDVLTFSGLYYVDRMISLPQNLWILVMIVSLLGAGMVVYRQGYQPAHYFLVANAFPLVLMMVLAIYFSLFVNTGLVTIASNLALILQALAFAIALVARVNLLKEELKQKQLEAQMLTNEHEQMVSRNKFIELENEYILAEIALKQNEQEELQAKLEANQRELASNALYIYQKNEMLTELQKQIERLSADNNQPKEVIREIKSTIQNNLHLESDWERFKLHFEQVHPTFFSDLSTKCADLTPYEVRLSAYLHLNMSTKEIATLLNINPDSVYKAKTRLNKKLEAAK
jgi:DNA-binding CsgD family transcriptional regulator